MKTEQPTLQHHVVRAVRTLVDGKRELQHYFLCSCFQPQKQLVCCPLAASEQLFSLTVVTKLVEGFLCVFGSIVAACSESTA